MTLYDGFNDPSGVHSLVLAGTVFAVDGGVKNGLVQMLIFPGCKSVWLKVSDLLTTGTT